VIGSYRMSKARSDAPLWPVVLTGVAIVGLSGGLYAISLPGDAEGRLEVMETKLKTLQASAQAPGNIEDFPAGSVCGGRLYAGYKDQVSLALGGGGLEVKSLEIADPQPTDTSTPLQVYSVSLTVVGPYEAAINGLNGLTKFRPTLFVDVLSLRNKTDTVELELKGRVFCR